MKTNTMRQLTLLFLSLMLSITNLEASDTLILGQIPTNSVWNTGMADTFRISGGGLSPGRTLTIDSGVVVFMLSAFTSNGNLIVNGTSGAPVVFTGDSSSAFSNLVLSGSPKFSHTRFVEFYNLIVNSGNAYFDDCQFNFLNQIIVSTSASAFIARCEMEFLQVGLQSRGNVR